MKAVLIAYLVAIIPLWVFYFIQSVRVARGLDNFFDATTIIITLISLVIFILNYYKSNTIRTSWFWKVISVLVSIVSMGSTVGGVLVLI